MARSKPDMKVMVVPCFWVLICWIMVICAGVVGYAGSSRLVTLLVASRATPWGIITSIFFQQNVSHLFSNVLFLAIFAEILLPGLDILGRRSIRYYILVPLCAAVAINVLWVLFVPAQGVVGSSILDFTLMGMFLGTALGLFIESLSKVGRVDFREYLRATQSMVSFAWGGSVGMIFMIYVGTFPGSFFSFAPGVDVAGHVLGFFAGTIAAGIVTLRKRTDSLS